MSVSCLFLKVKLGRSNFLFYIDFLHVIRNQIRIFYHLVSQDVNNNFSLHLYQCFQYLIARILQGVDQNHLATAINTKQLPITRPHLQSLLGDGIPKFSCIRHVLEFSCYHFPETSVIIIGTVFTLLIITSVLLPSRDHTFVKIA